MSPAIAGGVWDQRRLTDGFLLFFAIRQSLVLVKLQTHHVSFHCSFPKGMKERKRSSGQESVIIWAKKNCSKYQETTPGKTKKRMTDHRFSFDFFFVNSRPKVRRLLRNQNNKSVSVSKSSFPISRQQTHADHFLFSQRNQKIMGVCLSGDKKRKEKIWKKTMNRVLISSSSCWGSTKTGEHSPQQEEEI